MNTLADRIGGKRRVIGGPFGSNLTQKDYVAEGVPVIRGTNMEHHGRWIGGEFAFVNEAKAKALGSNIAHPGDIVVTQRGTLGQVSIIPTTLAYSRYVISQSQMAIAVDSSVADPHFVYYYLRSPTFNGYVANSTIQTGVPHINLGILRDAPALWPTLPEQCAIATTLGSLDDKIELNRRMNETLEAMAQAIFRDWFVDFGPSRRKLEGATDPLIIMGGLVQDTERAQALADLFPAALGDDGLPEGWAHRPFGSLLSDTIGGDWGKDTSEGENAHPVAIIRGTDFPELETGGVGKVPTRFTTVKKAARRKLLPSDILIEVSGGSPTQPTGRSIFITQSVLDRFNSDVVCASFCRRFRAVSHDAAVLAFEHLRNLYSEGGTWEYQHQSTGISNFQTTHFLEAEKVVFPGEELMEHFASLSGPMIEARYRNESMTLVATRDLLLPKLMSGEIRLSEAEDLMEAAQ